VRGDLKRTKLGDVESFWAEGSGPLTAGFTFRVGVSDETIPIRGITHMVEHLALQRLGRQPYTYNGLVDHLRTTFFATGSIVEISDFLRAVCTGIINPPLERLEHERQVLLTEGERYAASWLDSSLAVRYGPRGPGLSAYKEFGLQRITADDIGDWTERHFRAENAVLWVSGPPPGDLAVNISPGGGRVAASPVHPVAIELPAWYELGEREVAVSSVVPRSTAASALTVILEHRLRQSL
jgi:zinc protease